MPPKAPNVDNLLALFVVYMVPEDQSRLGGTRV